MTPQMSTVSIEQLERAIAILGSDDIAETEVDARIGELVHDPMLAQRLVSWIPETFGLVLVLHLGKLQLPKTFSAKSSDGAWVQIELEAEPIFRNTLPLAIAMFHSGPQNAFRHIATRSAVLNAANNLLNAGGSIDGAALSGPALIGIPAEIYTKKHRSFWRRLLRWW